MQLWIRINTVTLPKVIEIMVNASKCKRLSLWLNQDSISFCTTRAWHSVFLCNELTIPYSLASQSHLHECGLLLLFPFPSLLLLDVYHYTWQIWSAALYVWLLLGTLRWLKDTVSWWGFIFKTEYEKISLYCVKGLVLLAILNEMIIFISLI